MKQITMLATVLIFSLNSMAQFTQKEIDIIHNGSVEEPFRVLITTDEQDSLVLRTKSKDIDQVKENVDLLMLVQRLLVTMKEKRGVGIAAPQVGILKNVFLFIRTDDPEHRVEAAINPRIISHSDTTVCFEGDGCLSIPDRSENSIRYTWIEVEYTRVNGTVVRERLEGHSRKNNFVNIIFQHEFDHLQGVLFIDKICPDQPKEESEESK